MRLCPPLSQLPLSGRFLERPYQLRYCRQRRLAFLSRRILQGRLLGAGPRLLRELLHRSRPRRRRQLLPSHRANVRSIRSERRHPVRHNGSRGSRCYTKKWSALSRTFTYISLDLCASAFSYFTLVRSPLQKTPFRPKRRPRRKSPRAGWQRLLLHPVCASRRFLWRNRIPRDGTREGPDLSPAAAGEVSRPRRWERFSHHAPRRCPTKLLVQFPPTLVGHRESHDDA